MLATACASAGAHLRRTARSHACVDHWRGRPPAARRGRDAQSGRIERPPPPLSRTRRLCACLVPPSAATRSVDRCAPIEAGRAVRRGKGRPPTARAPACFVRCRCARRRAAPPPAPPAPRPSTAACTHLDACRLGWGFWIKDGVSQKVFARRKSVGWAAFGCCCEKLVQTTEAAPPDDTRPRAAATRRPAAPSGNLAVPFMSSVCQSARVWLLAKNRKQ